MEMKLHANATITPRTRAYVPQSTASAASLAREPGSGDDVRDHSHVPHRPSTHRATAGAVD